LQAAGWYDNLHTVKIAVSLPDDLFRATDDLARRRSLSRSALVAEALREYVRRHAWTGVREALDAVYAGRESPLDADLAAAQRERLPDEGW
jgi:metal-responsive CopG/Arc/MetJ family transcriptional regulator